MTAGVIISSRHISNDVAVTPTIDGTNFSVYMLPVSLGTQQVVAAIRDVAGNMGYATGTVFLTIVTNGLYSIDSAGCVTNIKYTGVQYSNNRGIKWDGQYRIKEVLTNGASSERYGFDALGRRVVTVSGGVTNFHVYDGANVLADTDATGGVLRVYGHGLGIDHLLTMTVYTSGTAKTYYYLTDRLGSVHALADETGNILESYRFDAWGKVTGIYDANGSHLSESAYGNRFLWQGREYSYRTGLYYFRARWYDPVTGRFLSNDPIGISGGLNQYVFCANNPVNMTDPFGLCGDDDLWFDRLGNWAGRGANFMEGANIDAYPWWLAGALNTVVRVGAGILSTPQAIGHLGEAEARYWDDPTLENLAAVYGDISLAAGLVAGAAGPAASVRNTNPFTGPVSQRVFIANPNGNVIAVEAGQSLTGSQSGLFLQVRTGGTSGPFTGQRLDGPHAGTPYNHAHVPGVGNHIPVP